MEVLSIQPSHPRRSIVWAAHVDIGCDGVPLWGICTGAANWAIIGWFPVRSTPIHRGHSGGRPKHSPRLCRGAVASGSCVEPSRRSRFHRPPGKAGGYNSPKRRNRAERLPCFIVGLDQRDPWSHSRKEGAEWREKMRRREAAKPIGSGRGTWFCNDNR